MSSTTPTSKNALRPSKFIEGPPLTSATANLAHTNEQLYFILQQMDQHESTRRAKSRTSSSSSSNSQSSTSSTSSIPFFASNSAPKPPTHDDSPSSSSSSTMTKRFGGMRASLDISNPFTAIANSVSHADKKTSGRRRSSSTVDNVNGTGSAGESSTRDAPLLGSKIKGRLRAWSRGKDESSRGT